MELKLIADTQRLVEEKLKQGITAMLTNWCRQQSSR